MLLSKMGIKTPTIWQVLLGNRRGYTLLVTCLFYLLSWLGLPDSWIYDKICFKSKHAPCKGGLCLCFSLLLGSRLDQIEPHSVFHCDFTTSLFCVKLLPVMVVSWVLKKLLSHICGEMFGAKVWNVDMYRLSLGYKATVFCDNSLYM